MTEVINSVFQGVMAAGAIAVVVQLYMFRRAAKYETCHRLHQMFSESEQLSSFHQALSGARENTVTESEIIKALVEGGDGDYANYRSGAESYAWFLRYLYYNVEQRLVHPKDAAQIVGPIVLEYQGLFLRVQNHAHAEDARWQRYFPEPPKVLLRALRDRYGADYATFFGH